MIGPCFPRFYITQSANRLLPSMAVGRMGETRGSCATGYDRNCIVRSAGEALERQMSFSCMPQARINRRLDELEERLSGWFKTLFASAAQADLTVHPFACVEAHRLDDNSQVVIPAVPFTLAPHPDARFMPNRDSSGCAIHSDPARALETAISELAERQGLALFWYFGHLNQAAEICVRDVKAMAGAQAARIVHWFNSIPAARVYLFDVSVMDPYRSVLAIYANVEGTVHFAAGGSASRNISDAISKALIELYQAYILTFQDLGSKSLERDLARSVDDITKGYLSFNTPASALEFHEIAASRMTSFADFCKRAKWVTNCQRTDILSYRQILSFGRCSPSLSYVSALSVPGFPLMSINGRANDAELQAAAHYGYQTQVRTGAVPFA